MLSARVDRAALFDQSRLQFMPPFQPTVALEAKRLLHLAGCPSRSSLPMNSLCRSIRRRWSRMCFLPTASVSLGDLEELVMAERCRIEYAGLDKPERGRQGPLSIGSTG